MHTVVEKARSRRKMSCVLFVSGGVATRFVAWEPNATNLPSGLSTGSELKPLPGPVFVELRVTSDVVFAATLRTKMSVCVLGSSGSRLLDEDSNAMRLPSDE